MTAQPQEAGLDEIAQAVAKALGLSAYEMRNDYFDDASRLELNGDGSNVFDDPWRWRCLEWLLERGDVWMHERGNHVFHDSIYKKVLLICPASEFPARAIHQLMQEKMKC
jgi:hypothetical protein